MAEIWLKFQTKYPESSELLPDTRGPPSIESLRSIMQDTMQDWENKRDGGFGRAKEKMVGFSETLVSFSDLFSIIPQGDKYVSLFTGVISTTIKACSVPRKICVYLTNESYELLTIVYGYQQAAARHKEIAEGFSSALEEIGKEMNFSTHELKIHRTKRMERLVIRLYIRHAKFFCHFMTWYLSSSFKRFGTSLRNDFYTKEVQHRVEEIRSVAKEIEQEASLVTQISTQRTEEMVRSLGPTVEEAAQRADFYHNIVTDRLETIDKSLEILTHGIGQLSRNHIVDHCDYLLYNADVANAISKYYLSRPPVWHNHSMSGAELAVYRGILANRRIEGSQSSNSSPHPLETSDIPTTDASTLLPRVLTFTRPSLQQLARDLQTYYQSTDPGESSRDDRDLAAHTVPGMVVIKLKEWLASPRSDILWVVGSNSPFGNEATLAASHILDIATSARLPCVSFSCTPNTTVPHSLGGGQTRCMTLLVALLYSLIHQLLCFVPETFEDTCDLEKSIQIMKGGEGSVQTSLGIIEALLRHRTPLLLIVLNGLELLEDDSTAPYLRNLISIIHSRQADSRLKVLLGSQGFLESGVDLDVDERVDCTLLPRRRPGRAQPDGRFLGELDSSST